MAASTKGADSQPVPLRVILFQSSTCSGCGKTQKALKEAKAEFGDRIDILWEDFDDEQGAFRRLFLYEDHYGVGDDEQPPTLFVGQTYINDIDPIVEKLNSVIATELAADHATCVLPDGEGETGESAAEAGVWWWIDS